MFTNRKEYDDAKRKYINANKKIKKELGVTGELKAAYLNNTHKRSLYNSIREYSSISVAVEISRVYDYILNSKKSRCRYKDYVLKLCVKNKLQELVAEGILSKEEDITVNVFIDQQLTATDGYYTLRDSIQEELQHGIINFNYGSVHPNVFSSNVDVKIQYCDSSQNYMIQACDILANRIWSSYAKNNPSMRQIPNHSSLTFP